jgi:phosphoglycolate phosphatase-like HAD superfamily hydrolase
VNDLKWVLFDLNGTLLDPQPVARAIAGANRPADN